MWTRAHIRKLLQLSALLSRVQLQLHHLCVAQALIHAVPGSRVVAHPALRACRCAAKTCVWPKLCSRMQLADGAHMPASSLCEGPYRNKNA